MGLNPVSNIYELWVLVQMTQNIFGLRFLLCTMGRVMTSASKCCLRIKGDNLNEGLSREPDT